MAEMTLSTSRPPAATAVGWLAVLGVVGSAVMTLAHLGVEIPVISDLGPGRLLAPVAGGFAFGTILYVLVATAAFRMASWAWPAALAVNAVAFLSAAFPYRGWVSGVAIAVSLAAVAVLLSPPGRAAFGSRST